MRRLLLGIALGLVGPSLLASPAVAHTSLQSASPAPGAEVESIEEIELTYTDPLLEGREHVIQLLTPDQLTIVAEGSATVRDAHTISLPIDAVLPGNGDYIVKWAIVTGDGASQTSAYVFTYNGDDAPFEATPPEAADGSEVAQTAVAPPSDAGTGLLWATFVVVGLAVLGWVLVAGPALRRRRQER